ncbi:DsbA family protein [Candidatus Gottesmanbacteria bacterium]|nr:DsbA family protein [Candidatus Gottesmanbacteria bacterium]
MNSKAMPILVVLLVVAAFLVGTFWTKIQYLEGGKQAPAPTSAPEQPEQKTLGTKETADLASIGVVKGNPNAKVPIVEFSDFQCPFCAQTQTTLQQIFKAYPDKVKFVYRHFPLPFHENAQPAALASMCANEQGKFWEYHDKLFGSQEKLTITDLKQYAASLGLDTEKFNTCLESKKYKSQIDKDVADGQAAGVSGTPAFFIYGRPLVGAQPFENFKSIIDEEVTK